MFRNLRKEWLICLCVVTVLLVATPIVNNSNTMTRENHNSDGSAGIQEMKDNFLVSSTDHYADRIESIYGTMTDFGNLQRDDQTYATLTERTASGYEDALSIKDDWSSTSGWGVSGWVLATGSLANEFSGNYMRVNGAIGGASGTLTSPIYNLAGCTGFNFICVLGAVGIAPSDLVVQFKASNSQWVTVYSWADGTPQVRDWYYLQRTVSNSQYMHSGFQVRYKATAIDWFFPLPAEACGVDYHKIYVPDNHVDLALAFDGIAPGEFNLATLTIDMHSSPTTNLIVSISHDGSSTNLGIIANSGVTTFDIKDYLEDPCIIHLKDTDASAVDPAPTSWTIARAFIAFDGRTYSLTDPVYISTDHDTFLDKLYGDGSTESPFVLKNMYITSGGPHGHGIEIRDLASHFIIANCTVEGLGTGHGILLYNTSNVQIMNSTISGITDTGVFLDATCSSSLVKWNIFEMNGVNAEDDGTGNVFNENYWDDYGGLDITPKDGIGDSPYAISGTASNHDANPLVFPPGRAPIRWVDEPTDQILEYGNNFEYDVDVDYLDQEVFFWINDTQNFAINSTGSITNSSILDLGVYGIRVSVNDTYGHEIYSVFNVTVTTPHIEWRYPAEGQEVIFPVGETVFRFQYKAFLLSGVWLFINGTNFGSVQNKDSIRFEYTTATDGYINATLVGDVEGVTVKSSRNFTFSKLTVDVTDTIDSGTKYLGNQLYMILHDPCGDNSYSEYQYQTGLSIGLGGSLTVTGGAEVRITPVTVAPGVQAGFSTRLEYRTSEKFDYRWALTQTTGLTSNKDSSNPDYIGPGYGDTYWGEAWSCYWILQSNYREYFNGTTQHESPKFYYQVIRSQEVLLNDQNAPEEWRSMNPAHRGWSDVTWLGNRSQDGGIDRFYEEEVTESVGFKVETSFSVSADLLLKFGIPHHEAASLDFTLQLEYKNYVESGSSTTHTTTYTVSDDDPSDQISMEYGIDEIFGTPIFRPNQIACKTSAPLEHNTRDYIPPSIGFPVIIQDTTLDNLGPCIDDQPIVSVEVTEEGGVSLALLRYSINDGQNWNSIPMSEDSDYPTLWSASLPAFQQGITVLWYIQVWDEAGLNSTRMSLLGTPFSYRIANRLPTVEIISPNGGEKCLDEVEISWSASDLDDDSLLFSLSYNVGGTGWRLLASGLTGTSYLWNISGLSPSDTVSLRIEADDGAGGVVFDESDYVFSIQYTAEGLPVGSTNTGPNNAVLSGGSELLMLGLGAGVGGLAVGIVLTLVFKRRT